MAKNTHEHHHNTLLNVIILAVILLTIMQVVLYRNIQSLKTMISETSMELKEGRGVKNRMDVQDQEKNAETQKMMDSKTKY